MLGLVKQSKPRTFCPVLWCRTHPPIPLLPPALLLLHHCYMSHQRPTLCDTVQ